MSRPPDFRAIPTTSPRGFRLEGEFDLSNASSLAELLEASVEAGGDITLDLAGVAFMDSTAIQVLLRAGKAIEGTGRVILYRPGSLVSNVLKLIKADRLPGIDVVGAED
jgi:anti-anti-sigma factor